MDVWPGTGFIEMDANEDGISLPIRHGDTVIERDEGVALAGHNRPKTGGAQLLVESHCDVECSVFL